LPCSGGIAFAPDGANRDARSFGCFLFGWASEVHQFNPAVPSGVHLRKAGVSLIQHRQPLGGMEAGVVLIELNLLFGALDGDSLHNVVDKLAGDRLGEPVASAQGRAMISDFAGGWRHKLSCDEEIVPQSRCKPAQMGPHLRIT
jgi:hypothetical protein